MKGKIYWIILVLVVIIMTIVVIWMSKAPIREEFVTPPEKEIEVKLKMGVGYSTNSQDLKTAVQETYNRMMEQLGEEKPIFAILYSTVGYDQKQLLAEVNRLLPGTKIYGYTSMIGVMTNDGVHVGEGKTEGYSMALMGFVSDHMTFGVGACSLDEAGSPFAAGKIAITRAIEDVGKTKEDMPKIVLVTTAPFGMGEEFVIAGIESILSEKVQLAGGVAGKKGDFSGGEAMFANDKVYQNGVVAVPIYTDLKIGNMFLTGFNPTDKKGTVTKFRRDSQGLHIVEIDGKPAAKVYNDWHEGLFEKYLGTSDWFVAISLYHPLAKKIVGPEEFINWQILAPIHFNPDDSLTVGAAAEEGTVLHLLEGGPNVFLDRAPLTVRLARSEGEITEKEIAGVVMDQCMTALIGTAGPEDWSKMVSLINQASGNAPFIGAANIGPYGYYLRNRYTEVTASVVVFSKD